MLRNTQFMSSVSVLYFLNWSYAEHTYLIYEEYYVSRSVRTMATS